MKWIYRFVNERHSIWRRVVTVKSGEPNKYSCFSLILVENQCRLISLRPCLTEMIQLQGLFNKGSELLLGMT